MLSKKTILIGSSVTGLLLIIISIIIILLTNKQPTKYTEKQCGLTANVISFKWRPDLKYALSDNGKSATITPESLSSFLAEFSPPPGMTQQMTPQDLDAIPRTYPVIWPFENDDSYTITTDDFSFDFSPYFPVFIPFDGLSAGTSMNPSIYPKIICNCTKKYISAAFIPDDGDNGGIAFVTTINPSKCIFEMCSIGQINFRFDKKKPMTRSPDDD